MLELFVISYEMAPDGIRMDEPCFYYTRTKTQEVYQSNTSFSIYFHNSARRKPVTQQ